MKTWQDAARDSAVSGALASVASTAALAAGGMRENGSPFAPTNAVSHYLLGDKAALHNEPSTKYTMLGYLIHHASANFWAVLYEKWFGDIAEQKGVVPALAAGAAVAGLACFTDYKLTPPGLEPGYEMRLSKKSLFYAYCGVAVGLAAGSILMRQRRLSQRRTRDMAPSDYMP